MDFRAGYVGIPGTFGGRFLGNPGGFSDWNTGSFIELFFEKIQVNFGTGYPSNPGGFVPARFLENQGNFSC